jgi:hypothetical protein
MNMFLDAVEGNLLTTFVRLETLARGYYGPDTAIEGFPDYAPKEQKPRQHLTSGALSSCGKPTCSHLGARSPDGQRCSKRLTRSLPTHPVSPQMQPSSG